jgi:hypothetical protein
MSTIFKGNKAGKFIDGDMKLMKKFIDGDMKLMEKF